MRTNQITYRIIIFEPIGDSKLQGKLINEKDCPSLMVNQQNQEKSSHTPTLHSYGKNWSVL